jgi:CubicO group peptidase (beta-lactamase class C family)
VGSLRLLSDVRVRLGELVEKHDVPGAVVGWLDGDEEHALAAGVLNLATGVAATSDSVFQIGSVTKVLTAMLVMQLLDDGRLSLDDPVRLHIPDLELIDESAAATVTVRQLLTHTSGIEGDHFEDFGRGADAYERLVGSLARVGQIHAPGAMYSYCNSGFVLLGHLVEKLRGCSWDDALRHSLARPLGLRRLSTLPEEAILQRVAAGHFASRSARPRQWRRGGPCLGLRRPPVGHRVVRCRTCSAWPAVSCWEDERRMAS